MNKAIHLLFDFPEVTPGEAEHFCHELSELVANSSSEFLEIEIIKPDLTTQDAGSILAIILTAPVLLPIAKGIMAMLSKSRKVRIKCGENELVLVNTKLNYDDIKSLLDKFINKCL